MIFLLFTIFSCAPDLFGQMPSTTKSSPAPMVQPGLPSGGINAGGAVYITNSSTADNTDNSLYTDNRRSTSVDTSVDVRVSTI